MEQKIQTYQTEKTNLSNRKDKLIKQKNRKDKLIEQKRQTYRT